jgi:RNA 2',3'-cyclic 3'-phosphodiesterase
VSGRKIERMETTPARPVRLFFALWPDQDVTAEIGAWQAAWQWPRRAAPVKHERLHMTLHFLGDVAAARLPELVERAKVAFDPFALEFGMGEVWPNGVAVLLPNEQPAPLAELHQRLGDAMHRIGLHVEERAYRPHVTLARRAWGASRPPVTPDLKWRVDSGYVLVRSLPGGAGYQILQHFS